MSQKLNINIYKTNRCVRSSAAASSSAGKEKGNNGSSGKDQTSTVVKKKLNIPIGDVDIDEDYEKNVTANFTLPPNLIRHTRRVGDEEDLLLDFIMDSEDERWLKSHPRFQGDKEIAELLTPDTFEVFINLFEKLTGMQDNYVTLHNVERCIPQSRVGHWPPAVMAKVLPDIYSYWVAKRNFLGKQNYIYGRALARKYWIPTAAGDTNPHHTFRVRDKEKYRLRRQQKRNDLESFRKLQQIRREFGQARVLTQLVIEREKCREAALEVATQVFEQRLFDAGLASLIPPPAPVTTAPVSNTVAKPVAVGDSAAKSGGNSTSSVPRRCATPYKHSLIYEHLLFAASAPYSFDKSMLPSPSGASASYSGTGIAGISGLIAKKRGLVGLGDSLGFSTNKMRGMKKIGVAGVPGVPGVPSDKKLKRKRNLEGFLAGGTSDDQSSEFVVGSLSTAAVGVTASPLSRTADASESGTGAGGGGGLKSSATFEASDEHLTALNSQYGTVTLASSFPSFMERSDLHGADLCPMLSTANGSLSAFLGDYMRDLQLRHSYSDGSGCGASASASGEAGLTVHLPDSYKVRGRVGRGGRMVLDRIPVYHSATDSDRCYSDCHSDSQDHEQQQGMQQGIHGIAEECSRGSSSALAGYQGSTGGMRVVYGAVLHPSRQQSRAERDRDREKERESAHCMTVPTVPQARFTVHHSNMNILGGSGGNNCHHYYTASARTQTAQFRAKCADIYAYPHVDNECVVFAGSGAGVDAGASAGVQISHTFNRLLALPEGQIKGAPVPVTSPELALQYTLYV